jgi:hypothetical protein
MQYIASVRIIPLPPRTDPFIRNCPEARESVPEFDRIGALTHSPTPSHTSAQGG